MSDINIEEILKRRIYVLYEKCYSQDTRDRLKEAIKEIVDLVVDKCTEEATLSYRQTDGKGFTFVATKESILKVKTQINYS